MTIQPNTRAEHIAAHDAKEAAERGIPLPFRVVSLVVSDPRLWCLTEDGRLFYCRNSDLSLLQKKNGFGVWQEVITPDRERANERRAVGSAAWDKAIMDMRPELQEDGDEWKEAKDGQPAPK